MTAKGTAEQGAAMTNKFRLDIAGLPSIFYHRVGELSRVLVTTELPDRTKQSTGAVESGEFEAEMLIHHRVEFLAVREWHRQCITGAPGYKRIGRLYALGADGEPKASVLITGLILKSLATPEFNTGPDDGSPVSVTCMHDYDDIEFL